MTPDAMNTMTTNPGAPGTEADGIGAGRNGTTMSGGCGHGTTDAKKSYKLVPVTQSMPKRVEKLLVRSLRTRARAGAMFGEAEELLRRAMAETRGGSREKVLVPGVVYKFSSPQSIDNKLKGTVQIVDQFAQHEVTAIKVLNRYAVKTWKGDGPKAEREERMEGLAGEELP